MLEELIEVELFILRKLTFVPDGVDEHDDAI